MRERDKLSLMGTNVYDMGEIILDALLHNVMTVDYDKRLHI